MTTLLFDLDGTLIDSASGIVNCLRYALDILQVPAPDSTMLQTWIGPPLRISFGSVLSDPARVEAAVALYHQRLDTIGWREYTPFQGVSKTIRTLHAAGHRIGIATAQNEYHARRLVHKLPFGDCFHEIVGAMPDGQRTYKHEIIWEAMRRLNAASEDCWMIGDRAVDIEGAKHNAVRSIGVLWGLGTAEELRDAHTLIHQPGELCALFPAG